MGDAMVVRIQAVRAPWPLMPGWNVRGLTGRPSASGGLQGGEALRPFARAMAGDFVTRLEPPERRLLGAAARQDMRAASGERAAAPRHAVVRCRPRPRGAQRI